MADQDWKPIIIKGTTNKKPQKVKELSRVPISDIQNKNKKNNSQSTGTNLSSIEKIADGDNDISLTIETPSRSLQLQISQARTTKGMKQEDFAKLVQIPVNIIKNYENGKLMPTNRDMQKMSKVLGVTLKK